ncbi:MAG: hypothetical protein WC389_18195 [Lutibacter sp.]|jgi:fumarate reductase subunit D
MPSASKIVGFLVALLILGILLPIGLADILEFSSTDTTIETLVTIVLPLVVVISIVLALIPKEEGK